MAWIWHCCDCGVGWQLVAPMGPPAGEPPYVMGKAKKKKKPKNQKKKKKKQKNQKPKNKKQTQKTVSVSDSLPAMGTSKFIIRHYETWFHPFNFFSPFIFKEDPLTSESHGWSKGGGKRGEMKTK